MEAYFHYGIKKKKKKMAIVTFSLTRLLSQVTSPNPDFFHLAINNSKLKRYTLKINNSQL